MSLQVQGQHCYIFSLNYFINLLIYSTNIYWAPNRAGSVAEEGVLAMNKTDKNPHLKGAYVLFERGRQAKNKQSMLHGNECNGV